MAPLLFLNPKTRSVVSPPGASPRMVSLAVEPSGEGPYIEAVREWMERVTPRPRGAHLQLLRR